MLVHQTNAALPAPSSPALGTHCAQVGKHHVVDCGQDVFSVLTSNWGKTRLMAHNLLHRTDLGYLKVSSDQPCSLRNGPSRTAHIGQGKLQGARPACRRSSHAACAAGLKQAQFSHDGPMCVVTMCCRFALQGDRLVMRVDLRVKLPPGANETSNAAFAALQQGA